MEQKNPGEKNDFSPAEPSPSTTLDQPVVAVARSRKYGFYWKFALGFLGWFLMNTLIWGGNVWFSSSGGVGSIDMLLDFAQCLILPLNLGVLLILVIIKPLRPYAAGVLAAISLNLLVSLAIGFFEGAVCFSPFYLNAPEYQF